MYSYLITGIIAGITSSVLYLSGTFGGSMSLLLYFLAPLPLFIAGLGWGAVSAIAGAVAGIIVCMAVAGIPGGLVYFASIGLIPIVLSHYALMSRASDEDEDAPQQNPPARDWYPLGRLILWIAAFSTVLTALFVLVIMPSTPELKVTLEALFEAILNQNPELKNRIGGADAIPKMIALFIALLPATLASYTFVTTTANFWLAAKIITTSGRAIRPPLVMSTLYYPRVLPLVLVALIVLSFLPGIIHTITLAAMASLTLAFMFLGLLVIHAIIPKIPARTVFLSMFYVTVFILLKYAYLGLALCGIAETVFGIRQRFAARRPPGASGPPDKPDI